MSSNTIYIRVSRNQFRVRNVDSGADATTVASIPFSTQRLLVGQFQAAVDALKQALSQVVKSGFMAPSPQAVMHPLEMIDGGLCEIEDRTLRELAIGAGAAKAVVWLGHELGDAEVKEKLRGK